VDEKVFLNGDILDAAQATVSIANPSLLHGVGLFETLRTYASRPFRLDAHIERMRRSAGVLGMTLGDTLDLLPDAISAVLKANELGDARVRFTVTPPGVTAGQDAPTLLVTAVELTGYPADLYHKGITIWLCTTYRQSAHDPLAGHKTTSYLPRLIALRDAQQRQCGEAIWFTPENLLAEGSISNVFVVRNGRLLTPPLDTPVLPGVTRASILELAAAHGIPHAEEPVNVNDLLDADEVFLTNAVMEVMPVTRVERRPIGTEQPGELTIRMARLYKELALA
jgi:branched-subunit amino acid aminotransferase/4-amino-4-deoxychorismate lyase